MSTETTPQQRAAQAMESPAVFATITADPATHLGSFAAAFQVPLEIFKGAFEKKVADNVEAEKAKGRNERIAAKATAFGEFINEVAGYDLPGSLIRLVEKGRSVCIDLTDEDSKVSPSFSINVASDGKMSLVVEATGLSSKKSGGSGSSRKTYTYFDGGTELTIRLKPYILANYGSSDAAGLIRDHDPKLGGTKKGAMSAFDAAMKDDDLKARITRVEKVKDDASE